MERALNRLKHTPFAHKFWNVVTSIVTHVIQLYINISIHAAVVVVVTAEAAIEQLYAKRAYKVRQAPSCSFISRVYFCEQCQRIIPQSPYSDHVFVQTSSDIEDVHGILNGLDTVFRIREPTYMHTVKSRK